MAKRDFSSMNTQRMYNTIADATAAPEEQQTPTQRLAQKLVEKQEERDAQETPKPQKKRRTYTAQEAAEIIESGRTSGRKGLKLPRINLAFTPDNYEYVSIMARVRGESLTDFVNAVLRKHREDHGDTYERAIEFRNSL